MKDLILESLTEALNLLEKRVPQTTKQTKYVNIEDINPLDLPAFIQKNNIPADAYFGGEPNGYDSFDNVCLCYQIDIPTSEKERMVYRRRVFSDIAFRLVYNILTNNSYKRVGYNTGLLKEFDDTTVYDMYVTKDFDRLVKYYSLSFQPL